ncbi:MAG: hypothetical protein MJA31_00805, partial [Clostridia bacterium]|nr:hypothetical protein [Clostridia bacterium]
VGIQIIQKGVYAKLIDLKLIGSNGDIIPFLHGETYSSSFSKETYFLDLEAEEYRFILNSEQIKGRMYIYLKITE